MSRSSPSGEWGRDRAQLVRRYLPALMLVVEGADARERVRERATGAVDAAIRGGVNIVQLRDKTASIDQLTPVIAALREAIRGRAPLFVNSPHVLELPEGGDGVHFPESGVRDYDGDLPLSIAAHSVEAARRAEAAGADMIVLGTIFRSPSHPGGETIGLDGVREVCAAVRVPVIGIGGITAANAGDVMRAGAAGVAAISAILDAANPDVAAAALRRAIDDASSSGEDVR